MTHCIQSRAGGPQRSSSLRFGGRYAAFLFAMLCCGGLSAEETPANPDPQPSQEAQVTDEISIVKKRETQLSSEALSISDTPDAELHVDGISGVAGLAAMVSPAYDGSKKTKASPYPYVDVHGFFNDRLYLSSVRGIGVNLLDLDHFRGGRARQLQFALIEAAAPWRRLFP